MGFRNWGRSLQFEYARSSWSNRGDGVGVGVTADHLQMENTCRRSHLKINFWVYLYEFTFRVVVVKSKSRSSIWEPSRIPKTVIEERGALVTSLDCGLRWHQISMTQTANERLDKLIFEEESKNKQKDHDFGCFLSADNRSRPWKERRTLPVHQPVRSYLIKVIRF